MRVAASAQPVAAANEAASRPGANVDGKTAYPKSLFSDPHRHQDVKRALVLGIFDEGGRTGIGKQEAHILARDLTGDVEEIARVEAYLNGFGRVIRADFLRCRTGLRINH